MVAGHFALVNDIPVKSVCFELLEEHAQALRQGTTVPIGSVEFVRKAMALAGIGEPENFSYPAPLHPYLMRQVSQRMAGSVLGHWFVKPTTTKAFSGFVFDTLGDPAKLCEHEHGQYDVFMALPPDAQVWVSEPVSWLSEFRYYVVDGEVLGQSRYDDGQDTVPVPDRYLVAEMALVMASSVNAPVAFGLDVGVLESGETALVECNDSWALGYYTGSISHGDYIGMLRRRWEQLVQAARRVQA